MLQKTARAKISSFPMTRSFSYFGIWRLAVDHSQVFKEGGAGQALKGGNPPTAAFGQLCACLGKS